METQRKESNVMKKNTEPTDRKRALAICGLSALCIAVLAGAHFLTREPEREFLPAPVEHTDVTDTWEENPGTDAIPPVAATEESGQLQDTASDNTQTVISEGETGSTISLSGSPTKEDALQEKPSEPPVTTDDVTNPNRQPEYGPPNRPLHLHPNRITLRIKPGQGHLPKIPPLVAAIPDRSMTRSLVGSMSGTPNRIISTMTATSTSRSVRWAATE